MRLLYESYNCHMSEPLVTDAGDMPVSEARERLAEVVNAAGYRGTVTYLTRRGKRLAAVVPAEAADHLVHSGKPSHANGARLREVLARQTPDEAWADELHAMRDLLDERPLWADD